MVFVPARPSRDRDFRVRRQPERINPELKAPYLGVQQAGGSSKVAPPASYWRRKRPRQAKDSSAPLLFRKQELTILLEDVPQKSRHSLNSWLVALLTAH